MNIYSRIRFLNKFDQACWRFFSGIAIAFLFFIAFMFSYALPASLPVVSWQFYTIGGLFTIAALMFAILVFDKEIYGERNSHRS